VTGLKNPLASEVEVRGFSNSRFGSLPLIKIMGQS
jgi:hypothetical protein